MWSYDPTDLNTTTSSGRLNAVRLLIGDTDTNEQLLQNEEITFTLSENSENVYLAASLSARNISGKFARLVTTKLDGALSAEYSSKTAQYDMLADHLKQLGRSNGGILGVYAGGITITQIDTAKADLNRVGSAFRRDRFKNPPSYQQPDYE